MNPVCSQYVVQRAGKPFGKLMNRPSVEYTGRGNDLICFAWNGRFFRSSIENVKECCDKLVKMANGTDGSDVDTVNVGTLEDLWGIVVDDSGESFGWAPGDDWAYPCFTYDILGQGTHAYDLFGEDVFLVSIPTDARPYECYWEV